MKAWDKFFGNPLISEFLTEAEEYAQQGVVEEAPPQSEDTATPEELDSLAADIQQGHLTQDDLVDMYKSGKLSQENISEILTKVESGGEEVPEEQPQDTEPQSEEELLAQQIDQTNDMFIKFALYDKTVDLTDKLNYFKDNFDDMTSDMYQQVIQLREFLNILSNLIFNLETSVSYQMYGNLLLQLTDLFKEYNSKIKPRRVLQEKQRKAKQDKIDDGDYAFNAGDAWAKDNASNLMDTFK